MKQGDRVRVRPAGSEEEWTEGTVLIASDNTKPLISAVLSLDGPVRSRGGLFIDGLPLTIDTVQEKITDLFGGEYEMEIQVPDTGVVN